jgi:hypothetical protein
LKQEELLEPENANPLLVRRDSSEYPAFAHEIGLATTSLTKLTLPVDTGSEPPCTQQDMCLPRPRTIVDEITSNPHLSHLERFFFRKKMVNAIFGSSPVFGHRRKGAKRVSLEIWDRMVTNWARWGGKGRIGAKFDGPLRDGRGRVVMVDRMGIGRVGRVRNKVIVSGRGSVPFSRMREKMMRAQADESDDV